MIKIKIVFENGISVPAMMRERHTKKAFFRPKKKKGSFWRGLWAKVTRSQK